MSTPTPTPTPVVPKLPNFFNASSVTAFLVAVAGFVMAFLVALDPHWSGSVAVNAVLPSVGLLVATAATLFMVVTHRKTQATIAAAGGSVVLPTWSDPSSVLTFLTTILGAVFGVLTVLHPGFQEPAVVHALLPSVAILVAVAAQIVNSATAHAVHRAVAVAKLAH